MLAHADPAKAPMSPCDLNDVLRETVEFVRSRREFGHVELVLELDRASRSWCGAAR